MMERAPSSPSVTNHNSTTGPNNPPTFPVPNCWMVKSPIRITTDTGTAQCASMGALTERPSTALSTDIAGVSMPSA